MGRGVCDAPPRRRFPPALATTDGVIAQTIQYGAFGNRLDVAGEVVRLPLGFASGLFDVDTGRFTALAPWPP
jgi:hypothetical protein